MNDPVLKNRLKALRTARNLTQEQLAELVGISRKSVNAIERDRYVPSIVISLRLAEALGVRVEDVFSLEGGTS